MGVTLATEQPIPSRAAAGTRVPDGYPGNFLLPGYPHTLFNLIIFQLILNILFFTSTSFAFLNNFVVSFDAVTFKFRIFN